jgi:uncharacterized protein YkwD
MKPRLPSLPLCTPALALALAAVPAWAGPDAGWPARVLRAVNDARHQQGLQALSLAPDLQRIAQGHSDDMAARRRLSHEGFQARFDQTSSDLCVENVAGGTIIPATLVAAWTQAPQHRRNLFEPRVRRAGIAVSEVYVTLFACE